MLTLSMRLVLDRCRGAMRVHRCSGISKGNTIRLVRRRRHRPYRRSRTNRPAVCARRSHCTRRTARVALIRDSVARDGSATSIGIRTSQYHGSSSRSRFALLGRWRWRLGNGRRDVRSDRRYACNSSRAAGALRVCRSARCQLSPERFELTAVSDGRMFVVCGGACEADAELVNEAERPTLSTDCPVPVQEAFSTI